MYSEQEHRHRIDLHTHTQASDGALMPQELVDRACRCGLRVLAVTDHDTVAGVQPAIDSARGTDLHVLAGVELSALCGDQNVHLVAHGIDHRSPYLCKKLEALSMGREARARTILDLLSEMGAPIPWERVAALGKESIARPHIARVLIEEGYAADIADAFSRFIGDGCPAYLPSGRMTLKEAVDLVREAGGEAAIAHPLGTHPALDFDAVLPAALAAGITGIEVYHTEHGVDATERLRCLAAEKHLWWTGGSDFHGPIKPAAVLGGVDVPESVMAQGPFAALTSSLVQAK